MEKNLYGEENKIEELLKVFKDKLNLELKEVKDINVPTIYEDFEILSNINEYLILTEIQEKNKDEKLKKKINSIEKEILRKHKIVKITGEEKSFYCRKGEAYDSDGNIIEDCYEYCLEEDDIFCEFPKDKIYEIMKSNLMKKINSKKKDDSYYYDDDESDDKFSYSKYRRRDEEDEEYY